MLELSRFEIKILFHNFKHKPDCVKKGQYCHYQEKMSRKEWLQRLCLQGPFLRKSMVSGSIEMGFRGVGPRKWGSLQSGALEGSRVVQVLAGQQEYEGTGCSVWLLLSSPKPACSSQGRSKQNPSGREVNALC